MRMNLSVVMGIVDQMRAPLQAISQSTNRYTEQIQSLQARQSDTSSQIAMIQSLQRTRQQLALNNVNIDAAAEKLARLEAQAAQTTEPSAQLTAQIARQRDRLQRLTTQQNTYSNNLNRLNDGLGEAGVNVDNLDDEFSRLNRTYVEQSQRLNQVSQNYQQVQRSLRPLQNMANRIRLPTLDNAKSLVAASAVPLASIGALGYVINDTANEINALSKAAKEVNMPVETMQALMLQATDAGAEADDMASAIREMALRWGEMKTLRSGAMHDYFKDTNNKTAFKNLMKAKDEAAAYQIIIDEIAKQTDVSKRNFMMDEFFGGDSEKLIAVLSAGTKGLEEARKKLAEMGGAVTQDEVDSAESYKASLGDLLGIINNVKFKVLTPIIKKLSETFRQFSESMKNAEWRDDVINKVSNALVSTYNAITKLAKGIAFIGTYWKELAAGLALVKIAMIAVNVAMLANPIGLIIVKILAAGVAITYLVSKFLGWGNVFTWLSEKWTAFKNYFSETLTSIIDTFSTLKSSITNAIGNFNPFSFITEGVAIAAQHIKDFFMQFSGIQTVINAVKAAFLKFMSIIPKRLLPDSWKQNIDKLNAELNEITDANATVDHNVNNRTEVNHTNSFVPMQPLKYEPITTQQVQSKSEVSLRIQSDKPVNIEKAKSDKSTDLSLDTGNMQFGY